MTPPQPHNPTPYLGLLVLVALLLYGVLRAYA